MTWRPLVEGPHAQRVRDAARAIGDEIASDPKWIASTTAGLYSGAAGIALLYAYLDETWPGCGYDDECARWVTRAVDRIGEGLPMAMAGGIGIAWVVEHLACRDAPDPNVDVDVAVADWLGGAFDGHYDLAMGLVGLGRYALERGDRGSARGCLASIVDRLAQWSQPRAQGLVWPTPNHLLPPHERVMFPDGNINLGLAHGQPGVLALLARVHAVPELADRVLPLLDGALAWLAPRADAGLGYYVVGDEVPTPARAAWCYGDPGTAAALLAASEVSPPARELAVRLARRSAALSPDEAGVEDAALCHGTAGLMLIFQRIANATGDEALRDAARTWLEHTLALARPGSPLGGYVAHCADGYESRAGLMDGAAGIALALLAASTEVPPAWDRVLMLS